jgi:pimeloyl-ACP methyl ester carboxylesterase
MGAISGSVIDYKEAGEGNPIIFLPGMEGDKEFWKPQLEALSGEYRVIACSLPVHRPSLSRTLSDFASEYIELMDSLGIEKAVIAGESFGGMVTQEIVINHPQRVAAFILCNTMDRPRRGGFGLNMFTLASFVQPLIFIPFLTKQQRKSVLMWVGKHRGFVLDPTPGNEALVDYIMCYGTACGAAAYLDRMITGVKTKHTYRLRDIKVPALIVRGEEDRLVGAETIVQLAGRIPGAELALIEEGGHCCTYTVPDASNKAILDWLHRINY